MNFRWIIKIFSLLLRATWKNLREEKQEELVMEENIKKDKYLGLFDTFISLSDFVSHSVCPQNQFPEYIFIAASCVLFIEPSSRVRYFELCQLIRLLRKINHDLYLPTATAFTFAFVHCLAAKSYWTVV